VKEINQHTDLRVKVTPERAGRKVTGFHFTITQEDQMSLDLPQIEAQSDLLRDDVIA
jgi:plasmid replication initiation protein